MTPLGLPPAMFWIFVAVVLAGSLGAIHYVLAHVLGDRPFAEGPPRGLGGGETEETGAGRGDDRPGRPDDEDVRG